MYSLFCSVEQLSDIFMKRLLTTKFESIVSKLGFIVGKTLKKVLEKRIFKRYSKDIDRIFT